MATSTASTRSLREQYLACKDLLTKSGLNNDDLIVWAKALQIENGRLDKALRRSSSARRRVQRCLEAIEIEVVDEVDLSGAVSEDKTIEKNIEDQNTRLEIKASITESTQQLIRLSKILADPLPSDDLNRMTSASMAEIFTQFDIKHVTDKFPWAPINLQRRLGIINRFRRWRIRDLQIANREAVREISPDLPFSSVGLDEILDKFEALSFDDERTSTPTIPDEWSDFSESEITLSTSVSSTSAFNTKFLTPVAVRPQSGQQIPLYQRRPVQKCAICFEDIDLYMSEELWREHVLEDLEPYACIVGTCAQSFCTFMSRDDWISHELTEHHNQTSWRCHQCTGRFDSSDDFRQHMIKDHTSTFLEHQLDSIVAFSKSVKQRCNFGAHCPLCSFPLKGIVEADARHIGAHLEEIALFVLQSLSDISDGDKELDDANISATQGQVNFATGLDGLVIGFARCIEAFHISISIEAGNDVDVLATQLSFQRMRFVLWGEAVGLVSGSNRRTSTSNTNLHRPDIRKKLEKVLSSVSLLLARTGQSLSGANVEIPAQSKGLCIFAEAYNRVYTTILETVKPSGSEIHLWSNKEVEMLPRVVHYLAKVMDNLELITSSFMALERLHHRLRNEVQAISEPSFLALIKSAAVELPGDITSRYAISDTASRCLEYVQSHGKPALDLALQDQDYGRALSVIKDEDIEYGQAELHNLQLEATTSPSARRILTELKNIWSGAIPFISVQLVGTNIDKLLASIEGPPDTPYSGGVFWITVQMPIEDPFGVPRLKFHTKIYHPNIDVRGNICADNPASWDEVFSAGYLKKHRISNEAQLQSSGDGKIKPAAIVYQDSRNSFQTWTLSGLLIAVCGLLASPNIHEPLVPEIARQYLDHYDWFCETARSVTLRYAIAGRPPLDTLVFPKGIPGQRNEPNINQSI